MKMASWNDLGEMSLQFTNLDLFDSLRSTGSIPTDIDYQKKIFEWIKWNVLQKTDLNCREEEWLISHTYHLYCCITKHWKENKGTINQNYSVFKAIIKPPENPNHSCLKCSPLPKKNKKIILIPNQVKKYKFYKVSILFVKMRNHATITSK